MDNQSNSRKLTMEDLLLCNQNNDNQQYSYKIVNNQKKYSHTQKVKP